MLAASPWLMLDGRDLSPVVEVWALQEPVVPATEAEEEPGAAGFAASPPGCNSAIDGAVGGCIYGAAMGSMSTDISTSGSCVLNAMAFSGIVAGTVAFANWYKDAEPQQGRPTRRPALDPSP